MPLNYFLYRVFFLLEWQKGSLQCMRRRSNYDVKQFLLPPIVFIIFQHRVCGLQLLWYYGLPIKPQLLSSRFTNAESLNILLSKYWLLTLITCSNITYHTLPSYKCTNIKMNFLNRAQIPVFISWYRSNSYNSIKCFDKACKHRVRCKSYDIHVGYHPLDFM